MRSQMIIASSIKSWFFIIFFNDIMTLTTHEVRSRYAFKLDRAVTSLFNAARAKQVFYPLQRKLYEP